MKPIDARIPYFLKKVNQFMASRSKKRNPYRYDRLMIYKKMMHERIEKEVS